jgi:alpha-glucosidase
MDSDGDGVGDLPGVVSRLDYLQWLGVDGVWLNPFMPSPQADWGYDVAEYCDVDPAYGRLDDVDRLVREAHLRSIRVLLDLVPNHTSIEHRWFRDARRSRSAAHRHWYVWADPAPDGGPPNNWLGALGGGPAWELDEGTGQYYLHRFLKEQADLNWRNPEVREAFDGILRFWLDRGVDGFRVDVVHALIHDDRLRDNPAAGPDDHPEVRRMGQRQTYDFNQPEVHGILRRWRRILDGYAPARLLVGETYLLDLAEVARYYGERGDELDLAFNFPFVFSPFTARDLAGVVEETERQLPAGARPTWAGSNHDVGRLASRWCAGDRRRAMCALVMLLTLRGTPFLYYGDELGMEDTLVPRTRLRDPAGLLTWPSPGRDRCRTPMQWSGAPGAGFTAPGVEPWLPFGDPARVSVERQREDQGSPLALTRRLLGLRRRSSDLRVGDYRCVALDGSVWAWRRGAGTLVALNLGDDAVTLPDVLPASGSRIAVASDPAREGVVLRRPVRLGPWEALVAEALG